MLMQLYTLSKELQSGSKLRIVEQEISHKQYQNQQRKAELREQAYKNRTAETEPVCTSNHIHLIDSTQYISIPMV